MRAAIATTLFTLLAGMAMANGIQGPDGNWYCDTGYKTTAKGCVPATMLSSSSDLAGKAAPTHLIDMGGGLYTCETGYALDRGRCAANGEVDR